MPNDPGGHYDYLAGKGRALWMPRGHRCTSEIRLPVISGDKYKLTAGHKNCDLSW